MPPKSRGPLAVNVCRLSQVRRVPRRSFIISRSLKDARPVQVPKPSIDFKQYCAQPDLYKRNCIERNLEGQSNHPRRIAHLYEEWKQLNTQLNVLRSRRNDLQRSITSQPNNKVTDGPSSAPILEWARDLRTSIAKIEHEAGSIQSTMEDLAAQQPNLTSAISPRGSEPLIVGYINEEQSHTSRSHTVSGDHGVLSHVDVGSKLELLDFAAAGTTSGWGWYYLLNEAALLEQALVQYALSVALKKGWKIVSPPSMVYSHVANACGFRPRDANGEQQVYTIQQARKDELKPSHSLAGTAEIPLATMKAGQSIPEEDLPLKVIGTSRCYRAEAGARGADGKGLYRVHEFTKVEMFAWTHPNPKAEDRTDIGTNSPADTVFDEMMSIQKEILRSLGLHCRILEMPSTDLGASAARKQDIEAYFPSRLNKHKGWGEVTSTSNCTDYQSRRLGTQVARKPSSKGAIWPYTVNGTAMAVPRILAALLENGWNAEDESVAIPEVLWPWMAGTRVIRKKS